jgi:hypothetical protein
VCVTGGASGCHFPSLLHHTIRHAWRKGEGYASHAS